MSRKTGIFKAKEKYIRARPVIGDGEIIVDKNGEKFEGLPGDWRIWDDDGYEYFLDKYQFQIRFQAFDKIALSMTFEEKKKKRKKNLGF